MTETLKTTQVLPEGKKLITTSSLQEVLGAIADIETLVSDLSHGFSLGELRELIAAADDFPIVLQDATLVFPEWASLDDASRAALVAFVQENCKFPANANVELFTQKLLSAAILLSEIYQIFVP